MSNTELFNKICKELEGKLQFLDDKPEENIASTVKALWLTVSGNPVSALKSNKTEVTELPEVNEDKLKELIQKRLLNIPLSHLTRRQNFMGIEFISDSRALIPRLETEILGNKALEISLETSKNKNQIMVMDVCCGSGNLALALASLNKKCKVLASDISEEAIELTNENISFLNLSDRVEAVCSDLFAEFETEKYYNQSDLIICNPPYIQSATVKKMKEEIAENEPSLAFDGGMLGIKIVQKLVKEAPIFLKKGGWLVFEIGLGQGDFIAQMCEKTQFYSKIERVPDSHGNIRVIAAQKKG